MEYSSRFHRCLKGYGAAAARYLDPTAADSRCDWCSLWYNAAIRYYNLLMETEVLNANP